MVENLNEEREALASCDWGARWQHKTKRNDRDACPFPWLIATWSLTWPRESYWTIAVTAATS